MRESGGDSRMADSRTPRGTDEGRRPKLSGVSQRCPYRGSHPKRDGPRTQHQNSGRGRVRRCSSPSLDRINRLSPQPELLNERAVAGEIFLLEIVEKAAALAHDLQ